MKYDYLVVGAGLYGAIFAHEAKAHGKSVLVVDKRPNIAGNIYTENIEGINVHKYGAHIFHTNNKKVWNYMLQKFFWGYRRGCLHICYDYRIQCPSDGRDADLCYK